LFTTETERHRETIGQMGNLVIGEFAEAVNRTNLKAFELPDFSIAKSPNFSLCPCVPVSLCLCGERVIGRQ